MGMALVMIIIGVFYIAQKADFLGVIQIFVYTGAVMMLFLFVLMLVGVDSSDSWSRRSRGSAGRSLVLVVGPGRCARCIDFIGPSAVFDEQKAQAGLDKVV